MSVESEVWPDAPDSLTDQPTNHSSEDPDSRMVFVISGGGTASRTTFHDVHDGEIKCGITARRGESVRWPVEKALTWRRPCKHCFGADPCLEDFVPWLFESEWRARCPQGHASLDPHVGHYDCVACDERYDGVPFDATAADGFPVGDSR